MTTDEVENTPAHGVSRRFVLAAGAVGAAGVVVGGLVGGVMGRSSGATRSTSATESVDVAIIGGGVAGAYVADRLAADGRRQPVVFEASHRIGGRLWSQAVPPATGVMAEFGGMRIPPQHQAVLQLAGELGLTTIPFPASTTQSLVRLRGTRLRRGEVERVDQFNYAMPAEIGALSPDELFSMINRSVGITSETSLSGNQSGSWSETLTWRGRSIDELSTLQFLVELLGHDGAQFVRDWTAFEMWATSASTWLGVSNSTGGGSYAQVEGGFDQIPIQLIQRAQRAGAEVRLGEQLLSIERAEDGSVQLDVLSVDTGVTHRVRARAVVLALSAPAMRHVVRSSSMLREAPALTEALDQLVDSQAVKAYLSYDRPWWTDLGIETGRSVSDSVLRQHFYLSSDRSRPALLLAGYAFGDVAADLLAPLVPEASSDSSNELSAASRQGITSVLSEVHGIEVPQPIGAVAQRWSDSDDGTVPLWGPGDTPHRRMRAAITPVSGVSLHVCGDALSLNQGWVMGALETASLVLQQGFGVDGI